MQLLPLVEMFCKWELDEDCTDLWALMVRFDSEVELESHELGRPLLFMVRDNADGLDILPRSVPLVATANPFNVVRERLSAAGHAIRGLRQQVQLLPSLSSIYGLPWRIAVPLNLAFTLFCCYTINCVWDSRGVQTTWFPL